MYIAISLHKIKKTLPQIKAAILVLDVEQLNPEEVDILMKIAPTDDEVCAHSVCMGSFVLGIYWLYWMQFATPLNSHASIP